MCGKEDSPPGKILMHSPSALFPSKASIPTYVKNIVSEVSSSFVLEHTYQRYIKSTH
jgi:hypothetical protein